MLEDLKQKQPQIKYQTTNKSLKILNETMSKINKKTVCTNYFRKNQANHHSINTLCLKEFVDLVYRGS